MIIYHYTNVRALTNIIKDDRICLWFTNYRYLNDASEGNDLKNVYKETVDEFVLSEKVDDEIAEMLQSVDFPEKSVYGITKNIDGENVTKIIHTEDDAYICCFSSDSDSLDMWRYYSKDDTGCAIGLYQEFLESSTNIRMLDPKETRIGKYIWGEVFYDEKEKKDYIYKHLKSLSVIIKLRPQAKKLIHSELNQWLNDLRFFFKHNCFKHENEIRAVLRVPKSPLKEDGKESYNVKYVAINGIIKPYVEVVLPKKALMTVNVSPIATDLAYDSIKGFVNSFNDKISVTKSELPVRY